MLTVDKQFPPGQWHQATCTWNVLEFYVALFGFDGDMIYRIYQNNSTVHVKPIHHVYYAMSKPQSFSPRQRKDLQSTRRCFRRVFESNMVRLKVLVNEVNGWIWMDSCWFQTCEVHFLTFVSWNFHRIHCIVFQGKHLVDKPMTMTSSISLGPKWEIFNWTGDPKQVL